MYAILLVDRVRKRLEIETTFLKRHDVVILTSPPGPAVVDLAREKMPDVVVVDVEDDEDAEDGDLTTCRALKADPATRRIPLVVVGRPGVQAEARRAGADTVVTAPVEQQVFLDALRRHVPLRDRRSRRCVVNLRFQFSSESGSGQAFCRSLSAHGAFLKSDVALEPGAEIDVRFWLPSANREIECEAVVRSTAETGVSGFPVRGIGVEFRDMSPVDRELLEEFIGRQAKRSLAVSR